MVAARYVNRELIGIFVVTLTVLLLVVVGGRFVGYLQEAALGKFSGTTVLTIVYLRLPEFVQAIAPFSLYIAILLALGRLFAQQEMVVLQGAGVGTAKLMQWLSVLVILVTLVTAWFAGWVTPQASGALDEYLAEQRAETEFETVNPGIFHIYDRGRRVTYSQDMSEDRQVLQDVFIAQRLDDGRQVNIWAESARQQIDANSGSQFLVLSNGRRYETLPGSSAVRTLEFQEIRQRLTTEEDTDDVDVEAIPTHRLDQSQEHRAQWHWRIGLPIFSLVGSLLAIGISRVKPRQGRFARIVPGTLLMFLYYLGMLVNQNAINEGDIPASLGLWVVHGLFLGLAVWLLGRFSQPVPA